MSNFFHFFITLVSFLIIYFIWIVIILNLKSASIFFILAGFRQVLVKYMHCWLLVKRVSEWNVKVLHFTQKPAGHKI